MKDKAGTIQSLRVKEKKGRIWILTDGVSDVTMDVEKSAETIDPSVQQLDVFLYQDKKREVVASAVIPTVRRDQYDWAEVVDVIPNLGVFVDIGTDKEILVSKDDLPLYESVWPIAGDFLYVCLDLDKRNRLLAKPATEDIFTSEDFLDAGNDVLHKSVSGRIYRTSKEGGVMLTDDGYRGFIHHSERKEEPRLGQRVQGRIIDVKSDGSVNISLRPLKQNSIAEDAASLLAYMNANEGMMPFDDKSDPEEIRATFHISKAAFKRALGHLMKEKKVKQKNGNTYTAD
ncbi:S1 RNA-binding domain-containing protein [Salinibacillus aidingensis]|uniref:S1 RNA-binding domain-containing protein n=1 Tax=Salinibacillus aidingensis TaxID=237684 RepID=A0ABN1AMI9_9BACI